ncbi:manganese efflux pump [Cohnella silvisoli]|uniref:Manganese efflux pump n=1 Tax=Cohnella silvisoli TaxID=2873699 RepID=A0ABV1KSX8_9BACL|nr:manganese efflux pump [Cohnella silvisoli]MCD9021400.1 manganese efflux pump [Cohnella silvisoli]
MHWFSILAIGIASNVDNLGIGLAFGARSTRVTIMSNLVIALLSMIATYIAMSAGILISRILPPDRSNLIGGIIIIMMGGWGILSSLRSREGQNSRRSARNPERADKDRNHVISWRESISLGLALALNCIATGFGAGASGVSPVYTALSVGIFSLITVGLGFRIGLKMANSWMGRYSEWFGSILLIAIGCYETFV